MIFPKLPKVKKQESFKIKFFFFFRFLGDGATYCFLPIFYMFVYPGDSPKEIIYKSILVAVQPAMAILSNFLISFIAGNEKKNITILKIVLPIEIALICSIGFVSFSFPLLLIFSCIAYFLDMGCFSLMDSMAGDINAVEGSKYLWVRLTGSIGYALSCFFIGFIVAAINSQNAIVGYSYGFLCMLPVYLLGYASLYILNPYDINKYKEENSLYEEKDVNSYSFIDLIKDKNFICYLIFIALLIGLTYVTDNSYSDYYSNVVQAGTTNKDPIKLSISYIGMFISEIVISVLISPFIKSKNLKLILFLAGAFLVIRTILLGTFTYFGTDAIPYALFTSANFLRGFSFTAYVSINVPILLNILGIKKKTKGIFLVNLSYNMVSLIGQLSYSSIIVKFKNAGLNTGHFMLFYIIAILSFLSLLLVPFIKIDKNKNEKVIEKEN